MKDKRITKTVIERFLDDIIEKSTLDIEGIKENTFPYSELTENQKNDLKIESVANVKLAKQIKKRFLE